MCVWDNCPTGKPTCTQEPVFWLMNFDIILLLQCSICFLLSTRLTGSKAAPQHSATSTMPDNTSGVLRWRASPSLLQTYCCSLWPNNSVFVSSDLRVFHQMVISSKIQSSFKVPQLEQGLLSLTADSQLMLMQNTLDCGHCHLSSSSF